MSKNVFKKIILAALSAVLAFSFCACKSENSAGGGNVNIWTASGAEKLLQEADYKSRYGNTSVKIGVFRNETEAAQIMITPEYDVKSYSVETADLVSADGKVLPKTAISVYHEKYIYVDQLKDKYSPTGIGWYPDALLPIEKAAEYGENKIAANKNQGVWISVRPDENQTAGTFKGNFAVITDGKRSEVPVEITVYDYTLSDKVHSKTSFGMTMSEIAGAELDSSVEMNEKYYEFLLDRRVSAQSLPMGIINTDERLLKEYLPKWLNVAEKYTRDDRCSNINLPFATTQVSVSGKTITSVDFDLFEKTLRAIVEYSVEKNINLLEKAGTYFIFFDEYDVNNTAVMASYNINKANELCEKLATEYGAATIAEPLKSAIVKSLAGFKHKVVGELMDALKVERAAMVPKINKYHTQEQRDIYIDWDKQGYVDNGYGSEMWTYTCWDPMSPSPTYHIEDILLSSRLLSWMMYDYDIVGNLYWSTTKYQIRTSNSSNEYPIQDYYSNPLRFPRANGDGFLLYPGRPYGIDGPVSSIRLESVCDGLEEYDLLYALEELYSDGGVTKEQFDAFTQVLYKDLFSGTLVRVGDGLVNDFANARAMLADLLVTADRTGLVIKEYENKDGAASVVISAPNSTEINFADGVQAEKTVGDNRTEYALSISLDKDENRLALTATADGKNYSLEINLGGKNETVTGEKFASLITLIPDGGSVEAGDNDGEPVTKITLSEANVSAADIDVSGFGIGGKASQITLEVYLYGDEETEVTILTKCAKSDGFTVPTGMNGLKLNKGLNKVTVSATDLNFDRNGNLSVIRFRFNFQEPQAVSFAVGKLTTVR